MNPSTVRALGLAAALAAAQTMAHALSAPALALDLRTSVYQHNWTSVYVGGQAGWSQMERSDFVGLRPATGSAPFGRGDGSERDQQEGNETDAKKDKGDSKAAANSQGACDPGWVLYENEKPPPSCETAVKAPYVSSLRGAVIASDAAMGGLHAGALYQMGTMVIGAEGRLDWARHKTDRCDGATQPACFNATTNWFGAGIAKLGFARGRALVYGSLGFAVVSSETRATNLLVDAVEPPTGFTSSHTIYGLAYGGGLSYALSRNWVLTADYLRYDLTDKSDAVRAIENNVIDHETNMTIDTFTARLSYHVGY